MIPVSALVRLLLFPGLLFAVPAAWLYLWIDRKAVAVMQQRIGPPFYQPFYDFIKLIGKTTPERSGVDGLLMKAWPVLSVAASLSAISFLPVFSGGKVFSGDLILLLALLELPSMFLIAAGFSSRSLYGEIGSVREAALSVAYNLLFLTGVIAVAVSQHSFRLEDVGNSPSSPLKWLGLLAILACLPAKLHINPFSLANAEQEIYAGPMTEYAGRELALWELAHGLEWVGATGLVACLAMPHTTIPVVDALLWILASGVLVLLLAGVSAATARLTIDSSVRLYWRFGLGVAVVVSSALLMRVAL